MTDEITLRLKSAEVFKNLKPVELSSIVEACTLEEHDEGAVIIRQGERGKTVWVVHRGFVMVEKLDDSGVLHHLATLGPGEILGEVSVATKDPTVASVRARGKVVLIRIPGEKFYSVVRNSITAMQALSHTTIVRLNQNLKRMKGQ